MAFKTGVAILNCETNGNISVTNISKKVPIQRGGVLQK